ncbi:MAG: VTT domain-containing protein [Actinomycetota bacterium]|nr:VTT domain-containing protein [Actinomycetota bacterium]
MAGRKKFKKLHLASVVAVVAAVLAIKFGIAYIGLFKHVSIGDVRVNRRVFLNFAKKHFLLASLIYMGLMFTSAFFLPAAMPLTLVGGFVFGVIPAVVLINISSVAGASLAFLLARHAAGKKIQEKYGDKLARFNRELAKNGHIYLIFLRISPILPFFMVNYLAGLTNIRLRTIVWTTSLGMLPGSVAFTYAGRQLGTIKSASDLYSLRVIAAYVLIALVILLPVIIRKNRQKMKGPLELMK